MKIDLSNDDHYMLSPYLDSFTLIKLHDVKEVLNGEFRTYTLQELRYLYLHGKVKSHFYLFQYLDAIDQDIVFKNVVLKHCIQHDPEINYTEQKYMINHLGRPHTTNEYNQFDMHGQTRTIIC